MCSEGGLSITSQVTSAPAAIFVSSSLFLANTHTHAHTHPPTHTHTHTHADNLSYSLTFPLTFTLSHTSPLTISHNLSDTIALILTLSLSSPFINLSTFLTLSLYLFLCLTLFLSVHALVCRTQSNIIIILCSNSSRIITNPNTATLQHCADPFYSRLSLLLSYSGGPHLGPYYAEGAGTGGAYPTYGECFHV